MFQCVPPGKRALVITTESYNRICKINVGINCWKSVPLVPLPLLYATCLPLPVSINGSLTNCVLSLYFLWEKSLRSVKEGIFFFYKNGDLQVAQKLILQLNIITRCSKSGCDPIMDMFSWHPTMLLVSQKPMKGHWSFSTSLYPSFGLRHCKFQGNQLWIVFWTLPPTYTHVFQIAAQQSWRSEVMILSPHCKSYSLPALQGVCGETMFLISAVQKGKEKEIVWSFFFGQKLNLIVWDRIEKRHLLAFFSIFSAFAASQHVYEVAKFPG